MTLKPVAPRSQVKHSTTVLLRSQFDFEAINNTDLFKEKCILQKYDEVTGARNIGQKL